MTDSGTLDIETSESAQTAATADTDESTAADVEIAGTTTEETTMSETTISATSQAATETTSATTTAEDLVDVETLGKDLPGWKLAGVMRHQRWASGKAVTPAVFDAAVAAFEGRPLGGGR